MTARTIRNVALAKDDENDWNYHIQVADDENENIPRFEIDPCRVVRIIDELADLSWSADIEMIEGLVPYLKAWCIFEYDVDKKGFTLGDLRTTFSTEGRL
jgi:hypothetical protein